MTSAEFAAVGINDLTKMGTDSCKPYSGPSAPRGRQGQMAERLAADSLARDNAEWIVFDPSMEGGEKELEEFLQVYAPSVTKRLVYKE